MFRPISRESNVHVSLPTSSPSQPTPAQKAQWNETSFNFGQAADNGDLGKVQQILNAATPEEKIYILSSNQAKFGLEGAICNVHSEMIKTLVLAYIESKLLVSILSTLIYRPMELDRVSAKNLKLNLPETLPEDSENLALHTLRDSLSELLARRAVENSGHKKLLNKPPTKYVWK